MADARSPGDPLTGAAPAVYPIAAAAPMQKDFHYCCIRVLAEAAGFASDDAETLAYASQYVDDATEYRPIRVARVPPAARASLAQDGTWLFEPTCTAHVGIRRLACVSRDVQRKIYISFHFVPALAYAGTGDTPAPYDYRVAPGSELASSLVERGLERLASAGDAEARTRALVALGIALHSYADTWAHQRFSGRHSSRDNDIERISVFEHGRWNRFGSLRQLKANLLPDVGHAEAQSLPDISHLSWAYEHDATGLQYSRSNVMTFLDAAESIHRRLCAATGSGAVSWEALVGRIRTCLATVTDHVEAKFSTWRAEFAREFSYDSAAWSNVAPHARSGPDPLPRDDAPTTPSPPAVPDPRWFMFHEAAREQREWVLSRIRYDLR